MSKVIRVTAESSLATKAVNVTHWRIPGAGSQAAEVSAAIAALNTFYNAIKNYVAMGTVTIGTRVVTVDQAPNEEIPSSNSSVLTTGTAGEVTSAAWVLSYRGAAIGPRYRGRLFLGPVAAGVVTSSGTVFNSTDTGTVASAFATLRATTASSIEFGVWSRTHQIFTPAVASSVSTAIGTQRRRLY